MNGLALAIGLVAYNNAMNLWSRFHGRLYVPANLVLSAALLGIAMLAWNLDARDIGLGPGQSAGALLGAGLGVIAASPFFIALRTGRRAPTFADDRMAGLSPTELVNRTLFRVPFGTALPEELAFRGVLFAVLAPAGTAWAAAGSSLAFGLWHIAPTYNLLEQNGAVQGRSKAATAVKLAGSVVLTALGGLILLWLRVRTGGIAAPFALHATLNSLGTVAAHLAHRSSSDQP